MTLLTALACLFLVLFFGCLAIALGTNLLRWLGIEPCGGVEQVLYAMGLFFAVLQVLLVFLAVFGWLNRTVIISLLSGAGVLAGRGWAQVGDFCKALVTKVREARNSPISLGVMGLIAVCFFVDALMAMAPLTGSDAILYHFTAPMLETGKAWEPIYWLPLSFYTGLGHIFTQLGLTLGSDHISMGLIYLAGAITTASVFVLARRLASERWAWTAALTFVACPMIYWQIAVSGCPDIWMAFYVTVAVLAASRGIETRRMNWWLVAGILAGAAAGVKYTAWTIPAIIIICCLIATRSLKWSVLCGTCAFFTGSLPGIRNLWWTGDPFFPFLMRWVSPEHFNSYTFNQILGALTPSDTSHSFWGLLQYPILFAVKPGAYGGFGRWFGPVVLLFFPLVVLPAPRQALRRIAAAVWMGVLITNELTAQQPRYLLPIFPLALAIVFGGVAEIIRRGRLVTRGAVVGSVVLLLSFGVASEAIYARDFLPAALGLEQREMFLQRMAPDYPAVSFINRSLDDMPGKVMVFFHYVYYLRRPFEIGDPGISWVVNPENLSNPKSLLLLLRERNVRWVVKSPDYPLPLRDAFRRLESMGALRSVFEGEASTFSTFRMSGDRVSLKVTILEVLPTAR